MQDYDQPDGPFLSLSERGGLPHSFWRKAPPEPVQADRGGTLGAPPLPGETRTWQ